MKKIILTTLALLAWLATPPARAWTYNDGDLLLVFHEGSHNNIEYDLGSVTNLLGQTNGYTTTITGWDPSLVTTEFGANLTGVKVILAATTSPTNTNPTAWITSSDPNPNAYNVSGAAWTANLHGTINSLGNRPLIPFKVPPAVATPTNAYSISPSDPQYGGASYDSIVSGGNFNSIATWAGKAPFSTRCPSNKTSLALLIFGQFNPREFIPVRRPTFGGHVQHHHQRGVDIHRRAAFAHDHWRQPLRQICQRHSIHHDGGQHLFRVLHQRPGWAGVHLAGGCRHPDW